MGNRARAAQVHIMDLTSGLIDGTKPKHVHANVYFWITEPGRRPRRRVCAASFPGATFGLNCVCVVATYTIRALHLFAKQRRG